MSRTVVFRADASAAIGGGHVMRCLSLADELARLGWFCAFATGSDTLRTVPALARSDHAVLVVDDGSAAARAAMAARWPDGIAWLVVDHYCLNAAFESACRPWARQIMVVDDMSNRPHDCDVLLDQAPGRQHGDYVDLTPGTCRFLFGPEFALLRCQFNMSEEDVMQRRKSSEHPVHILLNVGASDRLNFLPRLLELIDGLSVSCETLVIAGSMAAEFPEPSKNVRVEGFVENMAERMVWADLAVGAGGVSAWERCAMGLPSVLVVTANNQRHQAEWMHENGVALLAASYDAFDPGRVRQAIKTLVTDEALRQQMIERGRRLCDGAGASRVARRMAELTQRKPGRAP